MNTPMVRCGVDCTPNKNDVTHTTTPARTPILIQYKAVVVLNEKLSASQNGEVEVKMEEIFMLSLLAKFQTQVSKH